MAAAPRPSGEDFWAAAIATLGDDLISQIDFAQQSKLTSVDELLGETTTARNSLDAKSWSFTRNGKKVIVRDVLTKVAKWVNHFKEVGDIIVQYDPAHAALPWAGVRFLLNVALGDLNTYSSVLERTADIAEIICRNALVENLVNKASTATTEELRRALIKLYASILTYLAKARLYYMKSTAARVIKYGVAASTDLESTFKAVTDALEEVTQCSAILGLEAQLDMHAELKQMRKEFDAPVQRWSDALMALTDHLDANERVEILRWLSAEPYEAHHKQTHAEVMEGTGEWLLREPTFLQWKNESASSMLWLHGIPGSGKSKLTSIIVEDAQKGFSHERSPAPVYFYCSRSPAEPGRSDPSKIVASIARQLSTPVPGGPLLEDVVEIYKQRKQAAFASGSLRFEESKELIFKLLDRYKHTTMTIVIDALDECDEDRRSCLIELFEDLLKGSPCLLKIFVSSRDDQDIVYTLDSYPDIHLSSEHNSADINLFLQTETSRLIDRRDLLRFSARKAELGAKIVDELTHKARGMFRLASLQLQELCRQRTDEAIVERLGQLPKTLEALYQEIILRIEAFEAETDRQLTQNALSWLLCGQEQLPSSCFLAAVSRTKNGPVNTLSSAQLLQLCCNLVIYDSAQDAFRFSHLSVREFLETQGVYQDGPVNALVAEACLQHASNGSHISITYRKTLWVRRRFDLQEYCDLFWAEHAQKGWSKFPLTKVQEEERMLRLALRELLFEATSLSSWQRRVQQTTRHIRIMTMIPRNLRSKLWKVVARVPSALLVLCAFDLEGVLTTEEWTQKSSDDLGAKDNFHQLVNAEHGEGRMIAWHFENNIRLATDQKMVRAAAQNEDHGLACMTLLLAKYGTEIQITEAIVQAAAANQTSGEEIIALLLNRRRGEIQITENIIEEAAANETSGEEIIALLLNRCRGEIQITENVIRAAAANRRTGAKIMRVLLDKGGHEIQLTEDIIETAAKNGESGGEIMALLLSKSRDEIHITQYIVMKMLETSSFSTVAQFLDKHQDEIHITEDTVKAAAGNLQSGEEILALMLDRRGDGIRITEDIVQAAAANWVTGDKILALLLDKRGDEIRITEAIVQTAAANQNGGKIMALLLDKRGDGIRITEDIVKTAAANWLSGKEILALLLDKRGDEIQITEDIVQAAAANETSGEEIIALLLDKRGDRIRITKDIVIAAAQTSACRNVVGLLLTRRRAETTGSITTKACLAAAFCGQLDALRYLCQCISPNEIEPAWEEIGRFYHAADKGCAKKISELLRNGVPFNTRHQLGRTSTWVAAFNGHTNVVKLLAQQGDIDVNCLSASAPGCEDIVNILISAGAKVEFEDNEGQTAISVARKNGHDNIVRILLDAQAAQQETVPIDFIGRTSWALYLVVVILLGLVWSYYSFMWL